MNQGQPQFPPQYMSPAPAPKPNGGNKTTTYVLIGVIAVLVIALIGGLAWHISSENKREEQAKAAAIQQTQDSLKAVADAAQAAADSAKHAAVAAATTAARAAKVNTYRGVPASEATRVVINGHGVRMRTGPGKQYPFPQTWDGHAYTVSKGTSLPFLGDYGGWYAVRFEGGTYYVSSQFAYLAR